LGRRDAQGERERPRRERREEGSIKGGGGVVDFEVAEREGDARRTSKGFGDGHLVASKGSSERGEGVSKLLGGRFVFPTDVRTR
jgi:hypothetical protein